MSYYFFFQIPGLPKTTNGSHGSWQKAAGERKKWRSLSCRSAERNRPPNPLARAKLTLTRCSSNKPDLDNLAISFKGIVDGLKDARIIVDDSDDFVERKYLWEKAPRGEGKITVAIEEIVQEAI